MDGHTPLDPDVVLDDLRATAADNAVLRAALRSQQNAMAGLEAQVRDLTSEVETLRGNQDAAIKETLRGADPTEPVT